MNTSKGEDRHEESRRQNNNLDGRYREIGISAVAAAVRFQSDTRNLADERARDERTTANAYGHFAEG